MNNSKRKFCELEEPSLEHQMSSHGIPLTDVSIDEVLCSKKKPTVGLQAIKTFCRIRPIDAKNGKSYI